MTRFLQYDHADCAAVCMGSTNSFHCFKSNLLMRWNPCIYWTAQWSKNLSGDEDFFVLDRLDFCLEWCMLRFAHVDVQWIWFPLYLSIPAIHTRKYKQTGQIIRLYHVDRGTQLLSPFGELLRIPDNYDAKIWNLWAFWPVILLTNHLFKIR